MFLVVFRPALSPLLQFTFGDPEIFQGIRSGSFLFGIEIHEEVAGSAPSGVARAECLDRTGEKLNIVCGLRHDVSLRVVEVLVAIGLKGVISANFILYI